MTAPIKENHRPTPKPWGVRAAMGLALACIFVAIITAAFTKRPQAARPAGEVAVRSNCTGEVQRPPRPGMVPAWVDAAGCVAGWSWPPQGPRITLTGNPVIVDGDTLRFGDVRVRLAGGVDAFESAQECRAYVPGPDGSPLSAGDYPCGSRATGHLADLIGGESVTCDGAGEADKYKRPIVRCRSTAGRDLGAAMVASGWAVVEEQYGREYLSYQAIARKARRGAWAGDFQRPAEWRASRRAAQ